MRAKCRGVLALLCVAVAVSGCDTLHDSRDYDRHVNSRLTKPLEGGDFFWFDVKVSPDLPLDSEAAEQQRQIWLQSWLLQRKLCPAGYEVVERRPFEFLEHNPARLDIRYKVRCLVDVPAAEAD